MNPGYVAPGINNTIHPSSDNTHHDADSYSNNDQDNGEDYLSSSNESHGYLMPVCTRYIHSYQLICDTYR